MLLGKIKLYDIAKELNLTSKEVLEIAKKLNINAKSHLSSVEEDEAQKILNIEKNLVIPSHPSSDLIQNSRISAKENMTTDDLFTIKTL